MQHVRRDALLVLVVDQETRGEPKQMLTTCFVISVSLRGRKKQRTDERVKKESFINQILFSETGKLLGMLKFDVTSKLNSRFIDRINRTLRWQGEGNYMSRLIWEIHTVSGLM